MHCCESQIPVITTEIGDKVESVLEVAVSNNSEVLNVPLVHYYLPLVSIINVMLFK